MPEGLSLNNCLIKISSESFDESFFNGPFFELFDNEFNSLIVCNSINIDIETGEQTFPYFVLQLPIDEIGTCTFAGAYTMSSSAGSLTGIFLKYQSGEIAEVYDKLYTGTITETASGMVPDLDDGVDINIPLNSLYARIFETNYIVPAGVYGDDPVDFDSVAGIYSADYISGIKNALSFNRATPIAAPYTIEVDGASTISLPTTIQIHDYDKDIDVDISIRKYTDLKTGTTYTTTIPLSDVDKSILLCEDLPKIPMSVYFMRDINSTELIDK